MNTNHLIESCCPTGGVCCTGGEGDPLDPLDYDPCLTSALTGCCKKGESCCSDGCCARGCVFRNTMTICFLNESLILWDADTTVPQLVGKQGAVRTAKHAVIPVVVVTLDARPPVTLCAAEKTFVAVRPSSPR